MRENFLAHKIFKTATAFLKSPTVSEKPLADFPKNAADSLLQKPNRFFKKTSLFFSTSMEKPKKRAASPEKEAMESRRRTRLLAGGQDADLPEKGGTEGGGACRHREKTLSLRK